MQKRRQGSGRLILVCLIITAVALLLSYLFSAKLGPQIIEMAKAKTEYAAKASINSAINDFINSGAVNYDAIITFEKTTGGLITAVKTDVAEVNRLKTHVTEAVLESIRNISLEDISVPLGSLTSFEYLSGRGPSIPVRIIAARTAQVGFQNDFDTAGINQTIHRIYVTLEVEMTILSAGSTENVSASSDFCIAETVIVGSVPESYTYFSETDSAKDAAENYFNFS